jgi:hypothetical protein
VWDRAGASSRGSRLCQPRVSVDVLPLLSARRPGLLRSQGHCENPHYTGEPQDIINTGHPILEVDHIQDLAKGGLVPRLRASSPVPLDGGYPPGRFLIRLSVNALRRLAAR